MKSIKFVAPILILCGCFVSCIQDEELNAEADITACMLPNETLISPNADIKVNNLYENDYKAYPIYLPLKKDIDLSALAPEFELTPGATITPPSGSVQNFNKPVRYRVTSEDGMWHRTYVLLPEEERVLPTVFHFDKAKTDSKGRYYILYEELSNHTLVWASGNSGFSLAQPNATKDEYPTVISSDGMIGSCAKMVTRKTGSLGALVKKPIASGNLFIGSFDFDNALSKPLEATKFGEPFSHKPIKLQGWYKYKAGPVFYEGTTQVDRKDRYNIYAVFYEGTKKEIVDGKEVEKDFFLDGNIQENNYEDESMVALAIVKNQHETDKWEKFEINFDYSRYGKTIDPVKLKEGKYKLGIVFAASEDGANFNGAPESTLMIDEVEITYEKGE